MCQQKTVTKPGLIVNGRKTISGGDALKNFARNFRQKRLLLDKTAPFLVAK